MKILLISYHFPPYNAVGAVRPGKLAKFLHQRGHEVHVISASRQPFATGLPLEIPAKHVVYANGWSANAPVQWLLGGRKRVARHGYLGSGRSWLRRLGCWYKTLLHWPDAEVGWAGAALADGQRRLAEGGFGLIYVSAPPFSALRVGARLSRENGIPWVAEFRDLWSDNHAYAHPAWRRAIERHWEERLLRTAAALVTVSPPLARTLERFGKPVWEVRNGFDPDDLRDLPPPLVTDTDTLQIAYTGNVYPGHHDVDLFCEGLARLRAMGNRVRVQVAGRNIVPLLQAARTHGVEDWFDVRFTVARSEALSMQRAADVLLMFLWQGGEGGIYTTKLFEYAGAGRPILAVGPSGSDVAHWIGSACVGACASTAADVAALLAAWHQRKREAGVLVVEPAPGHDFTRQTQFAQLEVKLLALANDTREGCV
ncbi:MAG: glycosyltransferase [Pseudomonadota bacterium]